MSSLLTRGRWLSKQPLEWTGHCKLSAPPPQAPCLPLRGGVGCLVESRYAFLNALIGVVRSMH